MSSIEKMQWQLSSCETVGEMKEVMRGLLDELPDELRVESSDVAFHLYGGLEATLTELAVGYE